MNISIGISAAITAYSRIHMTQFKRADNSFDLLYSDTDSIAIDSPLPESFITKTELGKMKLEYIFKEGVYLAPKVYGGITTEGKEITKVKGFKNKISYETLKSLLTLNQDSTFKKLELNQEK